MSPHKVVINLAVLDQDEVAPLRGQRSFHLFNPEASEPLAVVNDDAADRPSDDRTLELRP